MLIKIIKVCRDEVEFENDKLLLNMKRKDKQVCKTKYPLLLVHGIFFRDFEKLNYWGRIPDELIKNGATIFYGNHSLWQPAWRRKKIRRAPGGSDRQ